jgi:hypothetical protein
MCDNIAQAVQTSIPSLGDLSRSTELKRTRPIFRKTPRTLIRSYTSKATSPSRPTRLRCDVIVRQREQRHRFVSIASEQNPHHSQMDQGADDRKPLSSNTGLVRPPDTTTPSSSADSKQDCRWNSRSPRCCQHSESRIHGKRNTKRFAHTVSFTQRLSEKCSALRRPSCRVHECGSRCLALRQRLGALRRPSSTLVIQRAGFEVAISRPSHRHVERNVSTTLSCARQQSSNLRDPG